MQHVGNIEISHLLLAIVLDKILYHKRNVALKQNIIFFSKTCCVRLLFSQYENLNILMWGKQKCRRTIESSLVFEWIVT